MADAFGGLTIPVPAASTGMPAGDAALEYIAGFCKAVLVANCATMWNAVATSADPIVRVTRTHDPVASGAIEAENCPQLFVWRTRVSSEQAADDLLRQQSTIRILWLLPPAEQSRRITHTPAFNAIAKVLQWALHSGRTPTWKVTGDTDTKAATRGSYLHRWCGFDRMTVGVATPAEITVEGIEVRTPFDGLVLELEVTESIDWDTSLYGERYHLRGTVGIAEDGELPGDWFETEYAISGGADEYDATEAIEADVSTLAYDAGYLVTSVPGRIDPDTYTATAAGATRPTWERAAWTGGGPTIAFPTGTRLDLDAAAALATGSDKAISVAVALQFTAHDASSELWSFDGADGSRFRVASNGGAQTLATTRRDSAGTTVALNTASVGTARTIYIWSFSGTTLTTYQDGAVDLSAQAMNVASLALTTFRIGASSGTGAVRIGALWLFPAALTAAEATAVTAALAQRWPY